MSLWDFLPANPSPPTCPKCGGDLEEDWVRMSSVQEHWRGVRAQVCDECGHVEEIDGPE